MATGEGTQKVRIPVGLDVSLEPFVDLVIEVQLLGRIRLAASGSRPTHANSSSSSATASTCVRPSEVWQCAVHFRMMVMHVMRRYPEDFAINVLRMPGSMW